MICDVADIYVIVIEDSVKELLRTEKKNLHIIYREYLKTVVKSNIKQRAPAQNSDNQIFHVGRPDTVVVSATKRKNTPNKANC